MAIRRDYSQMRGKWSQTMSETVVFPQLYKPIFKAKSISHDMSPFSGKPSEVDISGIDARLLTKNGENILIAERLRKINYQIFGDITVRWLSTMTGDILEPKTMKCQYFIYAYIDEEQGLLGRWWIIYPNKLLEGIRAGKLKGKERRNPQDGGSIFKAFDPKDLEREGCIYKTGTSRQDL